jgi:hypothetical protein
MGLKQEALVPAPEPELADAIGNRQGDLRGKKVLLQQPGLWLIHQAPLAAVRDVLQFRFNRLVEEFDLVENGVNTLPIFQRVQPVCDLLHVEIGLHNRGPVRPE